MHQDQPKTVSIGMTNARRPHRKFGIRQADRLLHCFIIGQTGTGKSSLLHNLLQQDIQNSIGCCLIDPHGDLAQELATDLSQDHIYWDIADPDCPYGYNPLTYVTPEYRPLIASGFIDVLRKQWASAWGARMEHLLRFAILALLERPGSTMQDIMPLFLDKDFRKEVVRDIQDEQVGDFWVNEYPAMNYKNAADGVAPIANKLGAFLAHPLVRRALCAPEKPLRMRTIIDEGTILIVNLSKGRLGADAANIVGGLIVSSLGNAAYSRQNLPPTQRRPYFLYVDEFHSFSTAAFANMLSEMRKYALGLIGAVQFTAQNEREVLEAILGNVGTLISFRVGATDAAILARQFGDTVPDPRDLVGLANHEVYIKMMIDGVQSKPFSARTLPPNAFSLVKTQISP